MSHKRFQALPGFRPVLYMLALLMPINACLHAETIILEANESPPFWSESMPHQGLGGEILQAISKASGLTTKIRFFPLKRLIEDTNNNDLGNPLFYMDNQDFTAIIPVAVYRASLFYYQPNHKQTLTLDILNHLESYRIGVLDGTLAEHNFFEQQDIDFETSYSRESLFKKLKHGRIDLVLAVDLISIQTLSQLYPQHIHHFKQIKLPHSTAPIAIMIAEQQPNAEAVAGQYRQGLQTLIDNGDYVKILEKYYHSFTPDNWLAELLRFQQLYDFSSDD